MHDHDRTPAPTAPTPRRAPAARPSRPVSEPRVLALQRTHGNRFVQRSLAAYAGGGDLSPELEQRIDRARGGGRPLDDNIRGTMESALGADLGAVRVHTGAESHRLNESVSARAFTTGSDVFFADGEYAPGTSAGRELVAHELTHIVQQAGGIRAKLRVTAPGDAYEHEADAVARAIAAEPEPALGEEQPGTER